ncbi:enoyl-CoA hydratase [Geomicrobium sp. JCM 19037]|uniref:enoyl-CoA hydratase/isomerase family protein n=1 Tax=Geomicrobium sp. JCM 19037 TaxID=1460634 RepID=UPI00045F45F1|nr:enoyl-CoA hydratase-related protein [Geomicrobium sp. JCM 19037]GAK03142.1 enoyl-CoA hydratase [Geomicrobium sp. JCM 19037]
MTDSFQEIIYTEKHNIATIRLNRPDAYNALTPIMLKEITKSLKHANKDPKIRTIMMTGSGRAFSAGQDLHSIEEATRYGDFLKSSYHPLLNMMRSVEKPIVAAVNGTAAGAGMSIALAADFRLVQPRTKFVSAFVNIGLIPDAGFLSVLPRIVGYAKAMEISVLGDPISGTEAVGLHLASLCIDEADWEEQIEQFTRRLADSPTRAVGLIKRYMYDGMDQSYDVLLEKEAAAQTIAGQSDDHVEGLHAFKEKRTPTFTGH